MAAGAKVFGAHNDVERLFGKQDGHLTWFLRCVDPVMAEVCFVDDEMALTSKRHVMWRIMVFAD